VKLVTPTLSVAVGAVHVTTAPFKAASIALVMFPGMFAITGGSVSGTVIVKERMVWFPAASAASKVTVVIPAGKIDPEL
jgi:hypothetical protein